MYTSISSVEIDIFIYIYVYIYAYIAYNSAANNS